MIDKKQILCMGGIALLALIAYANTINVPFLLDDIPYLVENSTIRKLVPSLVDYQHGGPTRLDIRPVADLTFRLNYQISQFAPWSYHLVNLLIHAANGCLLFLLAQGLLLLRDSRAAVGEDVATALAAVTAAIWVVHPLQVNAVTYIIQRWESLSAFFFLAGLYAFLRWRKGGGENWKWICLGSAYCAIGSKESAASLPVAIFLLDRYILSRDRKEMAARWKFYAVLAGSWISLAALVLLSYRRGWTAAEGTSLLSFEYFKIQTQAIWHYLRLLVWPQPLIFDYGYWPVVRWYQWMSSALVLLGLFSSSLFLVVRRSLTGYAGALVFLLLAVSSSFIAIPTVPAAEYRMYLPSAAVLGLLVVGGYTFLSRSFPPPRFSRDKLHKYLIFGSAVLIVVLLGVTLRRNHDFRSSVSIWVDNTRKRPLHPGSYLGLADAVMQAGGLKDADGIITQAREKFPENARMLYLAGMIKVQMKDSAEAETLWKRALELKPDSHEVLNSLGILYIDRQKMDLARPLFEELVRLRPYDVLALGNAAQLCLVTRDFKAADAFVRRGLALSPNDPVFKQTAALLEKAQWQNESSDPK